MTMGRLAGHLAELPGFVTMCLQQDSFNVRPPGGGSSRQPLVMTSRKQLLEDFDKNVAGLRSTLSSASDESLMKSWSLLAGEKTIFTAPKIGVVRSFCLNHVIHHRAQLGVYLRLNNVPVPSIYGPSADENPFCLVEPSRPRGLDAAACSRGQSLARLPRSVSGKHRSCPHPSDPGTR